MGKRYLLKAKILTRLKQQNVSCMFFLNKTPKPEWYEKLKMEERFHV